MIHVQAQIEPTDFDARVRQPGKRWLAQNAHRATISGRDFPNIWRNCREELRTAFHGICAYTASFIAREYGPSIETVDHFIPKAKVRDFAYEWSNFRFCNPRVNENKSDSESVMDPFFIQNGWFTIDFTTFNIRPNHSLPELQRHRVQDTIDALKLNDDDRIVQARVERIKEYARGDISFDYLTRKYPFLAMELTRQGLLEQIKGMIR